jgi:hypothetical protein
MSAAMAAQRQALAAAFARITSDEERRIIVNLAQRCAAESMPAKPHLALVRPVVRLAVGGAA